ncbi:MAG: hypothetical protein QXE80_03690 [Pyrobaculum sp.]
MFDRMVLLGNIFSPEEMEALLTFLNDNPDVVVALRKRKTVMLVNAEKIFVRKLPAVQKLVDSLELRNYLVKLEETPTFIVYKFRPAEVKELHDLAIAVYAISNLINQPQQVPEPNQPQPSVPQQQVEQKQTKRKSKTQKSSSNNTQKETSAKKTGKSKPQQVHVTSAKRLAV